MLLDASTLRKRGRDRLRATLPPATYDGLHRGYDFTRRRYFELSGVGRGHMLPDYLIIGAAKAGTTTLYAWLNDHPFVRPAATKQIDFFDWNYYLGASWYRSNFPLASEHESFAREHGRPFITGEATPNYLAFGFLSAERAAATVPEAKIIVMLRDPVDRAYSHFKMANRMGWEPLSFEEACEQEPARIEGEVERMRADYKYRSWNYRLAYLLCSRYAEQLEPWLRCFARERFHFVKTEALASEPAETLQASYAFLGLPEHQPAEYRNLNVGGADRAMAPETRARLTEYFAAHNQRLYDLVGIDLGW